MMQTKRDFILCLKNMIEPLKKYYTPCSAGIRLGSFGVSMAASQGNFELNVFMPVLIYNFLQSARLLAEATESFNNNCAVGIKANKKKMHENLHNSLMLATALNPYIGYENAAKTVKLAHSESISLREACIRLGFLSEEKFDEIFCPEKMANEED